MSISLVTKELSRKELKGIMAGSSSGGYCFGQCTSYLQCSSWTAPQSCGCYNPSGLVGYCKYHG